MKNFLINTCAAGLFLALCALCLWLLLNPLMLILAIIASPPIILLLFIIEAAVNPKPTPSTPPPPAPSSVAPPPPIRRCDTLTPLLLGLALGWWLGGGFGDGG